MSTTAQLILYDQLGTHYCYNDVQAYVFLCTQTLPSSPYGPLQLNTFSRHIEYEASKNLIMELQESGKNAIWQEVPNYTQGIREYCDTHNVRDIIIMTPSEPYMYQQLQDIEKKLYDDKIHFHYRPNTQFLISHEEFRQQFDKPPVMEVFYRWMRKKFSILMDGNKPLGGKRNYDSDNRKFDKQYSKHTHHIHMDDDGIPVYPTSRRQALDLLQAFVHSTINRFGELEDAMYTDDDIVHHSLLSTSINFGLLTPMEVITTIANTDTALNNKEGFIRQILGWREYMYHRFHYYKDSIYTQNTLAHHLELPKRFWWPDASPLQMYCVNHVLKTVKKTGYSHHITRLMIIGNFTLLMGYNPHHVTKWFWEMYADAFERVVTPNVLGMSQFADGGNLATKPYISSANYIHNMSNYCSSCYYDPKEKEGDRACPMNYLYRNFVDKHADLFKRQAYIVSNLHKMDVTYIRKQAQNFIDHYGRAID